MWWERVYVWEWVGMGNSSSKCPTIDVNIENREEEKTQSLKWKIDVRCHQILSVRRNEIRYYTWPKTTTTSTTTTTKMWSSDIDRGDRNPTMLFWMRCVSVECQCQCEMLFITEKLSKPWKPLYLRSLCVRVCDVVGPSIARWISDDRIYSASCEFMEVFYA